jgi:hypothetical protein
MTQATQIKTNYEAICTGHWLRIRNANEQPSWWAVKLQANDGCQSANVNGILFYITEAETKQNSAGKQRCPVSAQHGDFNVD